MDILNDYHPIYPSGPEALPEDEKEQLGNFSKRKKMNYDEWVSYYATELWDVWNMVNEHCTYNLLPFFNKLDYIQFTELCYRKSTKY